MNVVIDEKKLKALIDAGNALYARVNLAYLGHDVSKIALMRNWVDASHPQAWTEIKHGEPSPVLPDGWPDLSFEDEHNSEVGR